MSKHISRGIAWFVIVVLALSTLAACGDDQDDDKNVDLVKVAVALPLGLPVGEQMLQGAQLALDEVGGKVGDVTVELVSFDSSAADNPVSSDKELEAAKQAIADEAVIAYIGAATSDQAKAILLTLNKAGLALVSPSATWPGLARPGFSAGEPDIYYEKGARNFFRILPADDVQGEAVGNWVHNRGIQSVYVIDDGTGFGQGVSDIFGITAEDWGITIVGSHSLTEETTAADIQALAAEVVILAPEMVYYGGGNVPFGIPMLRALRTADPELMIVAPEAMFQDEVIEELGADLLEGVYVTTTTTDVEQIESASVFAAAYAEKYGIAPVPYVLSTYEAMQVILDAIGRAESFTREGVLAALAKTENFSGVMGTWSFTIFGETTLKTASVWQIRAGEWVFLEMIG
ncbi:MAG: branched-chain amino acid ABC transporter substrate-binding protein [Anaerolineae bacterium]|nr:branched-chain amino acid ABC transporter substrate-binding protein [Anaerolineae bacterium]